MADTKITSLLTPQVTTNPATDVLPIVNIADTLMASSGSTRKITVNSLLGAGGTATLASATITGALTVDTSTLKVDSTNHRVGILTATPTEPLTINNTGGVGSTGALRVFANDQSQARISLQNTNGQAYHWVAGFPGASNAGFALYDNTAAATRWYVDNTGVQTWQNVGGVAGTAMTLNSTGLGVGGSPTTGLLTVGSTSNISTTANALTVLSQRATFSITANGATDAAGTTFNYSWASGGQGPLIFRNAAIANVMTLDASGNVGIGVTPSAWSGTFRSIDIGSGALTSQTSQQTIGIYANAFENGTNYTRKALGFAAGYNIYNGAHYWLNAASGAAASTFAFGNAKMTLDASGNLLVGTTSAIAKISLSYSYPNTGIGLTTDNNSTQTAIQFNTPAGLSGFINTNSTTTTYNSASDYRLKESVAPLSGGLARVNALKPSVYKWKCDGSAGEGFLAHELAEVVPAAVSGEKDAVNADGNIKPQGVDLSKVVPVLVAAIQELTAEVNALKKA